MNKAKLKNLAKIVFSSAFISLMLVAIPVYAFDGATLSEIKISSKDNYSYKVILKTNKDVPVQKYVTSDNKIVIDLNNTQSAQFVNTIYNNTPEIDNVIVQSVANDKVRIFIQGLNIASSKIILDSRNEALDFAEENSPAISANTNNNSVPKAETVVPVQKTQAKTEPPVINLTENAASNTKIPETVKAQYSENNFQTYQNNAPVEKISESNVETVKNSMLSGVSLKQIFSKEGFDWILRIFALVFVVIGAVKFLNKPKNVTIDLSQENLKEREIELYRAANKRNELLSASLGSNLNREKQVKKSTYGANSQYAMKEYQNSQLPPQRLNRPENINSGLNQVAKLNSALKTTKTSAEIRRPAVNNSKINQKEVKTAKVNIDNVKFLENMAAIYQKSGREDLAQNIRQNIKRSQISG